MALTAANVAVAVTGVVSKGATSATTPTGTASAITGFTDMGYVSEDGVEITLPDSGDTTPIKAWQNGSTVRVIRTPSEDYPTWHLTFLETNKNVVESYFGVTITQSVTEGTIVYNSTNVRTYNSYIVDVVDGSHLIRDYIPRGIVTDVGASTLSNGDPIGYEITITGELDSVKGYNFTRWDTLLHT